MVKNLLLNIKYADKYTALDFNDDITEVLDFNYNNVKKEYYFSLHSDSNFLRKNSQTRMFLPVHQILLLTIHHMMVYSDRIRKNLGIQKIRIKDISIQ